MTPLTAAGPALLFLALAQAGARPAPCSPADSAALADASAMLQALDDRAARDRLAGGEEGTSCIGRRLARMVVAGWVEARSLVAVGGDPARLGPVNGILSSLEALGADTAASFDERLEAAYGVAAVRAAVAAAQDERAEMEVFLAHARDLAQQLEGARASSLWPLDIHTLEGELWLEVDWYDTARAAFERAGADRSARAAVGLARTLRRMNDPAACAAFARAASMDIAADIRREVDTRLAECRG